MLQTELACSGGNSIKAVGLRRNDSTLNNGLPETAGAVHSLGDLADRSDAVLICDVNFLREIEKSLSALWQEIPLIDTAFIALVPQKPAPEIDARYDTPISSFVCSASVFRAFRSLGIECFAET